MDDLSHIIKTESVAPHHPRSLCADGETLYYEDSSIVYRVIHTLPPGRVTKTDLGSIYDMCITEAGGKKLLVAVCSYRGVRAYGVKSGAEKWRVEQDEQLLPGMEKEFGPESVTPDTCGQLFFTDYGTHCIQMFSAADGRYTGRLEVDLGRYPWRILWSEKLSTLVVIHERSCIEFIKIQPK